MPPSVPLVWDTAENGRNTEYDYAHLFVYSGKELNGDRERERERERERFVYLVSVHWLLPFLAAEQAPLQ